MTRVLQLTDPRAQDVRLAGRQMATLARLAENGLPVAPGFIVTTECGEWADPEAEAAVYRAYHALGDGRGWLPSVRTVRSPESEDDVPFAEGSPMSQQPSSTLEELLRAIDICRGGRAHGQGRPYYPGPPAVFTAVGVLDLGGAQSAGAVMSRRRGGVPCESTHLWGPKGDLLDDPPQRAALDLGRRVGELLGAEALVEWALLDGEPVVVRARCEFRSLLRNDLSTRPG